MSSLYEGDAYSELHSLTSNQRDLLLNNEVLEFDGEHFTIVDDLPFSGTFNVQSNSPEINIRFKTRRALAHNNGLVLLVIVRSEISWPESQIYEEGVYEVNESEIEKVRKIILSNHNNLLSQWDLSLPLTIRVDRTYRSNPWIK